MTKTCREHLIVGVSQGWYVQDSSGKLHLRGTSTVQPCLHKSYAIRFLADKIQNPTMGHALGTSNPGPFVSCYLYQSPLISFLGMGIDLYLNR